MRRVHVCAHAKINWTLEVLGKRADGYHEIRSVMQTIDLADEVALEPSDDVTVAVEDGAGIENVAPEDNLALRAAAALREHAGVGPGVRIRLRKRVPVAAGLGGGSSDAAATLRGLRALWELDISDDELAELGAQIGSDVPFFLRGGSALVSGRGEVIEPLPDARAPAISIAPPAPPGGTDKTARMYTALRAEHDTDGSRTDSLVERIRRGDPVRDEDCYNVFEQVLAAVDAGAAGRFEAERASGRRPHLCGSGPAFFTLDGGVRVIAAAEATRISELA